MTQTLVDSLSGVEIIFPEVIDVLKFSDDVSNVKNLNLWLVLVETSPEMIRWHGVDLKNEWIFIMIGISEDWGYITIPTNCIKGITETKLRSIYCDIAKRLGATDVLFNGISIMEASS